MRGLVTGLWSLVNRWSERVHRKAAAAVILMLLAGGAAWSAWIYRLNTTCPALDRLSIVDASGDAKAALSRGDRHVLGVGGIVGVVPGVASGPLTVRYMPGTEDTGTEACHKLRERAVEYAQRYNQVIVSRLR